MGFFLGGGGGGGIKRERDREREEQRERVKNEKRNGELGMKEESTN